MSLPLQWSLTLAPADGERWSVTVGETEKAVLQVHLHEAGPGST